MPDELAEMRNRQDSFDVRLTRLEETVRVQADLRAAMDSDISDIRQEQRAQRGMLQALATTQSEHTARLTSIEARLGNVENRLGSVENRLGTVESTLGNVQAGVQTIIAMLDRHIADHDRS
jgi:chromosome segregation ATPase